MGARILHTSDWHLGKKLFREQRSEEHEMFLTWLKELIIEERIDLLLIAGDIFDVPNPPHQALETFNYFLHELSELKVKVFLIGGNHDSAILLEAALPFYRDKSITVDGRLKENFSDHLHEFQIREEKFLIQSLPYFRNFEIFEWVKKYFPEKTDIENRGEAIEAVLKSFFDEAKAYNMPRILTSHHLFGHFIEAGSEQSLSLSGLDSVSLKLLENKYDYVALGHIHKPQMLRKENPIVYYSGSPIAMRFSEKEKKLVSIIDISAGKLTHKTHEIPIFRKLVQINSPLSQWREDIDKLDLNSSLPAFVEVILKLEGPVSGLIDQVKDHIEKKGHKLLSYFPQYQNEHGQVQETLDRKKINDLNPSELFKLYYQEKFGAKDEKEIPQILLEEFKSLYHRAEQVHED